MIREIGRFHRFTTHHPLAKSNRSEAWMRWVRWQLRSRLRKGPHVVSWIRDAVLVAERGMTGITGNIYCGLHEFEDMALLLHFFDAKAGVFLDVGANAGSWTILASKVCHCETIAVEPVAETFQKLQRNICANLIAEKVTAHCLALGETTGTLRFSTDRDTMNQFVDEDYSGEAAEVPVVTMDALLDGAQPEMIKIDVEGAEEQVMAGASKTLADPKLAVVLLEAVCPQLQKLLTDQGFTRVNYLPKERRVQPWEAQQSGNQIWVRDPAAVEERCRQATEFEVLGTRF